MITVTPTGAAPMARCPSTRTTPCADAGQCVRAKLKLEVGRPSQDFSVEHRPGGRCMYFAQAVSGYVAPAVEHRLHDTPKGLS